MLKFNQDIFCPSGANGAPHFYNEGTQQCCPTRLRRAWNPNVLVFVRSERRLHHRRGQTHLLFPAHSRRQRHRQHPRPATSCPPPRPSTPEFLAACAALDGPRPAPAALAVAARRQSPSGQHQRHRRRPIARRRGSLWRWARAQPCSYPTLSLPSCFTLLSANLCLISLFVSCGVIGQLG